MVVVSIFVVSIMNSSKLYYENGWKKEGKEEGVKTSHISSRRYIKKG